MLIVIISGATIYFGYKLFYLVTERQGKLQIEGKDTQIGLSDVGPGIFFALFGSLILIIALFTQPYIERKTTGENGQVDIHRTPASSNESASEIALVNLCVDEEHNDLFEEGLEILSTLEWFYQNKKLDKISVNDKESILKFVKKGNFNEMLSVAQTISSYEDSYIFMASYLQYYYLQYPCN